MAALQLSKQLSHPHQSSPTLQPSHLRGVSSGGPPTTYTWTRNGAVITDGGPYSISIAVDGHSDTIYREGRYRSTLIVSGNLPGLYQYSATNRATITIMTGNHTIEGS